MIASVPLVSVDLLLVRQGKVLLGLRRDEPARGTWFVPGGRIRRAESIAAALQRVWSAELAGEMPIGQHELVGAYEHFYDCAFDGSAVATHYVVLAYRFYISETVALHPASHREQWWAPVDACPSQHNGYTVHPNTRAYFPSLRDISQ